MEFHHIPIMAGECMDALAPKRGGIYVDGTLGGGGHAEGILEQLPENGRLYGIDRDAEALAESSKRLAGYGDRFVPMKGNYQDMKQLLARQGVTAVDGILLNLGVSSHQLDTPERGFSYKYDAPLDMRMDRQASLTAYQIINKWEKDRLVKCNHLSLL